MPLRLLVGLGNPGPQYELTRHNVGFLLVDALELAGSWRSWKGKAEWLRGPDFLALKPLQFMNVSGPIVREFADFHKIAPADVLVCYDEFSLPFGKTRMRLKGSSGGHNGMESVIVHMGTDQIPRLRIGVGPSVPGKDPMDYVLKNFSKDELRRLGDPIFPRLKTCIDDMIKSGFELVMNRVNAPENQEKSEP